MLCSHSDTTQGYQTRKWKCKQTQAQRPKVRWRAGQTETQASGWNNKHSQGQMICKRMQPARLPSSGRTEQEQQFNENFTFMFTDKTPQVTAKAREQVQYTFLCTCPDWSQGGTAGHLETISMTLFEKTVLRRVVWEVIVQSSSVSMSQINSVTRHHCVSHSEKDLFTNYWWKVDVDYALCKKTLWVMYNS